MNNDNEDKNKKTETTKEANGERRVKKIRKAKSKIRIKVSVNAFRVLMDSQKKVIGTNSPGKKLEDSADRSDAPTEDKIIKSKRKIFLERWADTKGAGKMKQMEENRSARVTQQLKKQKKRFTNMLLHKSNLPSNSEEINPKIVKLACESKLPKKFLSDFDGGDSDISDDSNDFITKLQPSLRKTDISGYFNKLNDKNPDNHFQDERSDDDLEIVEENVSLSCIQNTKITSSLKSSVKQIELENNDFGQLNSPIVNLNEKENIASPEKEIFSRKNRRSKRNVKYVESSSDDSLLSIDSESNRRSKKKFKNNQTGSKTDSNVLNKIDKNIATVSPIKIVNLKSPNIKCVKTFKTRSVVKEIDLTVKNVKIAPMFLKGSHKPKVNPVLFEARQKFLYSDMPKCVERLVEINEYVVPEHILFPKISHVQQITPNDDINKSVYNLVNLQVTIDELLEPNNKHKSTCLDFLEISQLTQSKLNQNMNEKLEDTLFQPFKINSFKEGLQHMKTLYPKFPVFKVFRQLKHKFDSHCPTRALQSDSQKNNLNESFCDVEIVENILENEKCLWTEKYKALSAEEIIGNFNGVDIIKKWLVTWKDYSRDVSVKGNKKNEDSSSDFCSSDSDDGETSNHPNNTIIIVGPQGSGKTNAVYAIANELEINILEINASSKRTGKKIITELQEATQSHKVTMRSNSEEFSQSLKAKKFNENNSNGKRRKQKLKSFQTVKKRKSNRISSDDDQKLDSQKSTDNKMSLILIEDADIVFEEDDGFISSLAQIIQISKRPIIITASDAKCSHLKKIVQECNIINFHSLSGKILSPWLDILMLVENKTFIPKLSEMLIEFNKGDMRKTIQQLQFWIANNESNESHDNFELIQNEEISIRTAFNEDSNISQDGSLSHADEIGSRKITVDKKEYMSFKLFEKLTFCSVNNIQWDNHMIYSRYQNLLVNNKSDESLQNKQLVEIDSLSNLTDLFSNIDVILSKNENLQFENRNYPWHQYLTDSLSESENLNEFTSQDFSNHLCQHLLDEFGNKIDHIKDDNFENLFFLQQMENKSVYKHRMLDAEMCTSMPINASLSPTNITLDYLPSLRNICRLEKIRSTTNIKRNNRFYHYLKSLDIDIKENVFNEICEIFNI